MTRHVLGLAFSCAVAIFADAAPVPLPSLGTDARIGGTILRGPNCLYAAGGGNVGGRSQIVRIPFDAAGLPTSRLPAGEICKGGCNATVSAIYGKWLFSVGKGLKGMTVRHEILPDGTLANRTELSDPSAPACSSSAMVASGNCLVVAGGWQTRQVFAAEVRADGTLGPWETQRPLPSVCFSAGRLFRLGSRLYAAGNQTFRRATDRIFSAEVDADGKPTKWRRWADLPEQGAVFSFEPLPDGRGFFYANHETGAAYAAPLVADGEVGDWAPLPGRLPTDPLVSLVATVLPGNRFFRLAIFQDVPRAFLKPDYIDLSN